MNHYKINHYKRKHYKIKHYKIKHHKINHYKTSHYKNKPLQKKTNQPNKKHYKITQPGLAFWGTAPVKPCHALGPAAAHTISDAIPPSSAEYMKVYAEQYGAASLEMGLLTAGPFITCRARDAS